MEKGKEATIGKIWVAGVIIGLIILPYAWVGTSMAAEKPQRGGTLIFAVEVEPPSYDAHRESTYAMVYPTAPHYSLLLKFDPEHYPKVVGDLAESWTISADQKTYTFKIHKGVKFHDGSPLTAKDVKVSFDKIIFPASGVMSVRKALYAVVSKVEAPDDHTVTFHLKFPSASFLAMLAAPYNYIYKADILAKDPRWYEKNVIGSGPYKFVEHVTGSHWVGKRNEDYFVKGHPYLDGYRVVFIKDPGARAAAIRAGRVHAEFRGHFSTIQRDDMVRTLGDKIRVLETSQIVSTTVVINSEAKPFNDPRVRRALSLAIDRWGGSAVLYRISNCKEVGGLLRPSSEFSLSEPELTRIAGFSKDIEASRKEARRLLREAAVPEGFNFELIRPPTQTYEPKAIYAIDQWRLIGLNVKQKPQEWGIHNTDLRSGNYKVALSATADFMDEPDLQLIKYISLDKNPENYCRYQDPVLDDLYFKQTRTMDPVERRKLCNQFERRFLDEMAYGFPILWTYRLVMNSAKVKGWKILPSHVANQDLLNVWLDRD